MILADESGALDPGELRTAFGRVPAGVVAVAGVHDGAPHGLAASTFLGISLAPPLVAFSIQWTSTTWPVLERLPRLGVSVLGAGDGALARRLAGKGDRFTGTGYRVTDTGAVLLPGSTAWLETSVHQVVEAGDHGLVLLRVHGMRSFPDVEPLVFHASGFRALLP